MKSLVSAFVFLALGSACLGADDFHGQVVSESGAPLAGVRVLDMPRQEVTTDASGKFTLLANPRGVATVDKERSARFTQAGYQPLTQVLKMNGDSMIVLKRDPGASWAPMRCAAASTGLLRGDVMAFSVPADVRLTRTQDVDYSSVTVESGSNTVRLAWGAFWSWGIPGPSFFSNVSKLQERTLTIADDVTVAEYRGQRSDGTYFRYIGMYGETVAYEGAAKAAADYFDRILDSICWARIPASTRPQN